MNNQRFKRNDTVTLLRPVRGTVTNDADNEHGDYVSVQFGFGGAPHWEHKNDLSQGWTKDWPTEVGWYWFYGDSVGAIAPISDNREMLLVEVTHIGGVNGSLAYITGSRFIMHGEVGVYVRWMEARLPSPPEIDENGEVE